LSDLADGFQLD